MHLFFARRVVDRSILSGVDMPTGPPANQAGEATDRKVRVPQVRCCSGSRPYSADTLAASSIKDGYTQLSLSKPLHRIPKSSYCLSDVSLWYNLISHEACTSFEVSSIGGNSGSIW